ncbi:MAG TPA: hypothetical protein VK172_10315 [Lentimicrobium sp.]|nr:hypothetical protein [Lentimicrobium sp.]
MKSHELKVSKYEYEKVMKDDVKINIPEEPYYYQDDNYRTVIGLFPKFYDPQKKFQHIEIIEITNDRILRASFVCTPQYLTDVISVFGVKGRSDSDYLVQRVIEYLMSDDYGIYTIPEPNFYQKLQDYIRNINSELQLKFR